MDGSADWVEAVDSTLMDAWLQKEVAASVGLEDQLAFPRQDQTGIVCARVHEGSRVLLSRVEPERDASGWFAGCCDPDHDHQDVRTLRAVRLYGIASRLPFVTQFLALPPGAEVIVEGPGHIRAVIRVDGQQKTPRAGSYLAMLNSPIAGDR